MSELRSSLHGFISSLLRLGMKHKNIVMLVANERDLSYSRVFAAQFPTRHFTFGNSFQSMVNTAVGMSLCGKIPFVCASARTVIGRGFDAIRTSLALSHANVKIVGTVSLDGGAFFDNNLSYDDFSALSVVPAMKLLCPSDSVEAAKIGEFMSDDYGLHYVRLCTDEMPELYDNSYTFRFGFGDIIRDGNDVALLTLGCYLSHAMQAAELLEIQGISTRVVNISSIQPLDVQFICDTASSVKKLYIVEDYDTGTGLGSFVSDILSKYYPKHIIRIGIFSDNEVLSSSNKDDKFPSRTIFRHVMISCDVTMNTKLSRKIV